MSFTLVYLDPDGGEKRIRIEKNSSYKIGASSSNDIVFPQRDVSREHAVLSVGDGSFRILDLKSKNGTFVNGNRTSQAEFDLGDFVNLSSARFFIVDQISVSEAGDFQERDVSAFVEEGESGGATKVLCRCISYDDIINLFGTTARAMEGRLDADPLVWGVNLLGLKSGLVLHRDAVGQLSVIASAGDIGTLIARNLDFEALSDHVRNGQEPRVQHLQEIDDDVLVAALRDDHFLLLRYESSPPAVGDVLILAAAINMLLLVRGLQPSAAGPEDIDLKSLKKMSLADARRKFEGWMIDEVLRECRGNQSEAARRLGMTRAGLYKRLKKA